MDVLKRFPIKYVRDYIKKDYKIRDECFICGSKDNLELHHLYSLSQLWEAWCREHNLKKVESVEIIKQLRITFADENKRHVEPENSANFLVVSFSNSSLHCLAVFPVSSL